MTITKAFHAGPVKLLWHVKTNDVSHQLFIQVYKVYKVRTETKRKPSFRLPVKSSQDGAGKYFRFHFTDCKQTTTCL